MNHIVVKGDTLSAIAKKYNTSVSVIQSLNPQIKDVNKIVVGQVIKLPSASATKDYFAIGKALENCLNDIENLESYKYLKNVL